jgi:hypothetical protein
MVLAPDQGQPTERFLQPFRRLTVQKHILVVEDDDDLRVLIEELLGDQGYSVALTGTNALACWTARTRYRDTPRN